MIVVKYYICISETYPYTMQSDGVCYEFSTYIEDEDPAKLKRSKKRKQELFDAIKALVTEAIRKEYKHYLWWKFNVFDDNATFVYGIDNVWNTKFFS